MRQLRARHGPPNRALGRERSRVAYASQRARAMPRVRRDAPVRGPDRGPEGVRSHRVARAGLHSPADRPFGQRADRDRPGDPGSYAGTHGASDRPDERGLRAGESRRRDRDRLGRSGGGAGSPGIDRRGSPHPDDPVGRSSRGGHRDRGSGGGGRGGLRGGGDSGAGPDLAVPERPVPGPRGPARLRPTHREPSGRKERLEEGSR